jgi:hypothetical protein
MKTLARRDRHIEGRPVEETGIGGRALVAACRLRKHSQRGQLFLILSGQVHEDLATRGDQTES